MTKLDAVELVNIRTLPQNPLHIAKSPRDTSTKSLQDIEQTFRLSSSRLNYREEYREKGPIEAIFNLCWGVVRPVFKAPLVYQAMMFFTLFFPWYRAVLLLGEFLMSHLLYGGRK